MTTIKTTIPLVLAGPIIRHISTDVFTLWLVTSEELCAQNIDFDSASGALSPSLFNADNKKIEIRPNSVEIIHFKLGHKAFIYQLLITQEALFQANATFFYDIEITTKSGKSYQLSNVLPDLLYPNQAQFSVKCPKNLTTVIHGSCRKAHFSGDDALPQLDNLLATKINKQDLETRPDILLLTGDQVYVDDVAGPMLFAIQQIIDLLGLFHEKFEGSQVQDSIKLWDSQDAFYERENLLPKSKDTKDLNKSFFKGKKKPIFTSVNASNHLIALNEMAALYLLSWSSRLWPLVSLDKNDLKLEYQDRYNNEKLAIKNFVKGLPAVERAFAHVATYMIFDDHDVTDDWNLTRAWEEEVYANPFSNRIVGNALVAYYLFQGIGNPESAWRGLLKDASTCFSDNFESHHAKFIEKVYKFENWHYGLDTQPKLQVLDTRTQRWRSESNEHKPSGLMDWENLCELQQNLIGEESVIMVSAAPVYGVKFIEAIQKLFIVFGGALVVDAENWMAHKGTASVMLNIFRHVKTPPHFIILSGDVHYSFVYDVGLRFRRNSPKIVQFTASGIHNEFPKKLITWFERINRWFYGYRSPLNWLTKRRNMSIKERNAIYSPVSTDTIERGIGDKKDIVNGTCLGLLTLNDKGHESGCRLILSDGSIVEFKQEH